MHFRLLRAAAVLLAGALLAVPLHAQSPAQRAALAGFTDSLARAESPADPILGDAARNAPRTPDPFAELRRGLAWLRIAELGEGREAADRAEAAFDESAYRAPDDWPWPWYALARAKLVLDRLGATAKPTMHQPVGDNYRNAALRSLGKSLEAEPGFAPAAELLAGELLPKGDRDLSAELQRAVRRAASTRLPGPLLVLGRVYRNLDRQDSALGAFSDFVRAGGDSGVGLLEQARALHALGRVEPGVAAYLDGATRRDTATRNAYRDDLVWVASPLELMAFDSLPADSVGAWIAAFWSNRDATELRAPGERLAEHLRRWNHAFSTFRLPPLPDARSGIRSVSLPGGRDMPGTTAGAISGGVEDPAMSTEVDLYLQQIMPATRGTRRIFDDRAIVYMRYGEPDALVATVARPGNIPGGINWKYNTTAGPLIYHFSCQAYCVLDNFPVSLDGMVALDARYEQIAVSMRSGRPNRVLFTRLVRERAADLVRGLQSDGYSPKFERQMEPVVQVFATGIGPSRALVVFALPGEQLVPTPLAAGGVAYPVTLRLIATNAAGEIRRLDTTRTFRTADQLKEGAFINGLAELPLPPGRWDVRAIFSQPGAPTGGAVGRLGLVVPAPAALALSDLVFGREGAGLAWRSPSGPVPLNPLDVYPRNGTVELYYEALGLVPGRRYRSTVQVKGVAGDAKGEAGLVFEETADGRSQAFRRSIDLTRLQGGQYRLTLKLEEIGGEGKATRDRLINVLAR